MHSYFFLYPLKYQIKISVSVEIACLGVQQSHEIFDGQPLPFVDFIMKILMIKHDTQVPLMKCLLLPKLTCMKVVFDH